jgi:hypothetical protein
MTCADRPTSRVAIVDKAFANMYCIDHSDLFKHSSSTLKDRAGENWDAFVNKGFSR